MAKNTGKHIRAAVAGACHDNPKQGRMEAKNLDRRPDDTIKFDNGKLDIATIGEATVGRFTLEPGWKWSTSVKP